MTTVVVGLNEEDRALLLSLYTDTFLHGECYAYAIALSDGLGWPIVGLIKVGPSDYAECDVVWHAGVRAPDGRIHDIRGYLTESEFGAPYGLPIPYVIREVTADELYVTRARTGAICQRTIAKAREVAGLLWPDLPWKDIAVARATAFVDELEKLCRKHGFWIRAPHPTTLPILYEAYGDEKGFVMKATQNGHTLLFDRRLE